MATIYGITNQASDVLTYQDFVTVNAGNTLSEGISFGFEVEEATPNGTDVLVRPGRAYINTGGGQYTVVQIDETETVPISGTGSGVINNVVIKVDQAAAKATALEIAAVEGTTSKDPTLLEDSNVFYFILSRVTGNGGNITNADIEQFGLTDPVSGSARQIATRATDVGVADGWYALSDCTVAFDDATTIQITAPNTGRATTVATYFNKGTKIALRQPTDGQKYFYVINNATASSTTIDLTIVGGDDYDLDNEVISDFAYSNELTPSDFPNWLDYSTSVVFTGFSSDPVGVYYKFKLVGDYCHIEYSDDNGTSNATSFSISLPIESSSEANYAAIGVARAVNAGSALIDAARVIINASDTVMGLGTNFGSGSFGGSGSKGASHLDISYRI